MKQAPDKALEFLQLYVENSELRYVCEAFKSYVMERKMPRRTTKRAMLEHVSKFDRYLSERGMCKLESVGLATYEHTSLHEMVLYNTIKMYRAVVLGDWIDEARKYVGSIKSSRVSAAQIMDHMERYVAKSIRDNVDMLDKHRGALWFREGE